MNWSILFLFSWLLQRSHDWNVVILRMHLVRSCTEVMHFKFKLVWIQQRKEVGTFLVVGWKVGAATSFSFHSRFNRLFVWQSCVKLPSQVPRAHGYFSECFVLFDQFSSSKSKDNWFIIIEKKNIWEEAVTFFYQVFLYKLKKNHKSLSKYLEMNFLSVKIKSIYCMFILLLSLQ